MLASMHACPHAPLTHKDGAAYDQAVGRAVDSLRALSSISDYLARERDADVRGALARLQSAMNAELDRADGVAAAKPRA